MAMKEKIKNILDLEKERINKSRFLSADEKLQLAGLVSEAAECTNGLTEQEKIQNLSETTFGITTVIVKVMDQLSENNNLTKSLDEKMGAIQDMVHNRVKRDIRDLGWADTIKLCLVKPWIWIFLGVVCFSPKGLEILQMLLQHFQT